MQLPFGSYRRNVPGAAQRLVNVMAEATPQGKGPTSLIRTPGIRAHKEPGSGAGRGLGLHDNKLYAVSGTKLYQVPKWNVGGAPVLIGSIPGTARCRLASNTISLAVLSKPNLYALTAGVLAQVVDADYTARGANSMAFFDGYLVFTEPDSPNHFSSDLYSLNFDGLKFSVAEGTPDDLVDSIVNQREWVLAGKKSLERWYNSGADNYPFEKMSGGDVPIGCLGGLALNDNAEHFHANDNTLRRLNGQTAERFSTHAVEEKLRTYTGQAVGFSYVSEGHLIYVVTWADQATWCFDATTGEFHERMSTGQNDWRVVDAIEIDGVTYVQDKATGKVGVLDPTCFDEWGQTLRAEWTYPTIYDHGRILFHTHFELIIETGVGLAAGQGSDPEVMLEFSDDGGKTWLAAETRTIGQIGEYSWRVMWHELGSSVQRVYRCSVSDPVKVVVSDTRAAAEPGDS